jgi:hypothetical protein
MKLKDLNRVNYTTNLEDGAIIFGWAKRRDSSENSEPAELSRVEEEMMEKTIISS